MEKSLQTHPYMLGARRFTTRGGKVFYSEWAFSPIEEEVYGVNLKALAEYEDRYIRSNFPMTEEEMRAKAEEHPGKLVYFESSPGYSRRHYHVISNPENLSGPEIALIIDRGNLCFGFHAVGADIDIYTD